MEASVYWYYVQILHFRHNNPVRYVILTLRSNEETLFKIGFETYLFS